MRFVAETEVPRRIGALVLLIDDAVDRHASAQYVVSHEHVQHVKRVGIVVARTDADTLLVDIVIPGATVAIPFSTLGFQIIKIIDAGSAEHVVGLGKYRPLDHTLLRIIE